jgi:hypothetical protein
VLLGSNTRTIRRLVPDEFDRVRIRRLSERLILPAQTQRDMASRTARKVGVRFVVTMATEVASE